MKRRKPPRLPSIDLLESGLHLLRVAPASALLAYFVGSVPFVLGLLFFWSDMSRSPYADQHIVGWALFISVLFVWMKVWQSVFCNVLRITLAGEAPEGWTPTRIVRTVSRQLAIQPSGLLLLPIAFIIFIPFGWLFTFYHNVSALGARGTEPLRPFIARAWRQALFDAMENQILMFVLMLLGMFVWLNITIAAFAIPHLIKSLLGIETPFTLSMQTLLNTTFLAVTLGVAYLCIDPLAKACYVLRCFHGESRQSGQDLMVTLRRFTATAVLLLSCVVSARTNAAESQTAPPPTPARSPQQLDRAIDEVLQKPQYTWRSPRQKRVVDKDSTGFKMFERFTEWAKSVTRSFKNWLDNLFKKQAPKGPPGMSWFSKEGLTITLIMIVAGILGYLLYLVWRIRLKQRSLEVQPAIAIETPNLADENITAEQLPEDGWVRLALEMLDRGELRLAMRAFYLASLAHLASRDLLTLARSKSNRDYERELSRKGHAIPDVAQMFSENVLVFDRIWYGLHDVTSEVLEHFRTNVERIKSC